MDNLLVQIFAGAVLFAALAYTGLNMFKKDRNEWKVVLSRTGSTTSLEEKYLHLKRNNLKCHLKYKMGGLAQTGAVVLVHKDDVEEAERILNKFD